MTDRNWKATERRVARVLERYGLKARRVVLSGRNNRNVSRAGDIDIEGYEIEVKSGRQIPKAVENWLGAIREFSKDGRIPILVMQPFRIKATVAVLAFEDLAGIIGALNEAREHGAQKEHPTQEELEV